MKYQIQNKQKSPLLNATRTLAGVGLIVTMATLMIGCSVTSSRTITATHWGAQQNAENAQRLQKPTPQPEPITEDTEGLEAGEFADEAVAEAEAKAPPPTALSSNSDYTDMTLYIGYVEAITSQNALNDSNELMSVESHVRFCNLKPDASLVCQESLELNKMLNPHMH